MFYNYKPADSKQNLQKCFFSPPQISIFYKVLSGTMGAGWAEKEGKRFCEIVIYKLMCVNLMGIH